MGRHLAIDATHVNDPHRTGIGRVVEEQLRSIAWLMQRGEWPIERLTLVSAWQFRLDPKLHATLRNGGTEFVVLPFSSMYVYRGTRLVRWCTKHRPDLLYIPEPIHPGLWSRQRFAAMHYDLIVQRNPEVMPSHIRLLYQTLQLPTLRRAVRLGVDSETIRNETAELVPGFAQKSEALPIYIHEAGRKESLTPDGMQGFGPYCLYVGNLMPHKNIRRLLAVFREWKRRDPEGFVPLCVVGRAARHLYNIEPLVERLADQGIVRHFGYVSDENLEWLYQNARVFVFPSLSEGFGLPILEAMSRGCPVITSRGIATEEAAGGAAELVNPESGQDILRAVRRVSGDEDLRRRQSSAGIAHAETFTRERHACAFRSFIERSMP